MIRTARSVSKGDHCLLKESIVEELIPSTKQTDETNRPVESRSFLASEVRAVRFVLIFFLLVFVFFQSRLILLSVRVQVVLSSITVNLKVLLEAGDLVPVHFEEGSDSSDFFYNVIKAQGSVFRRELLRLRDNLKQSLLRKR